MFNARFVPDKLLNSSSVIRPAAIPSWKTVETTPNEMRLHPGSRKLGLPAIQSAAAFVATWMFRSCTFSTKKIRSSVRRSRSKKLAGGLVLARPATRGKKDIPTALPAFICPNSSALIARPLMDP